MDSFQVVQNNTHCIFAKSSKIFFLEKWDSLKSIDENCFSLQKGLVEFTKISETEEYDGCVFEITEKTYGETIEKLTQTTKYLLTYLSENDPAKDYCMRKKIEDVDWCYTLNGERLYILTFAPCYDKYHARYSFGSKSTFILFQTQHSFKRKHDPPESYRIPEYLKEQIRYQYNKNDRPYDLNISLGPFEAYRFVKPLKIGDPIIKWWI